MNFNITENIFYNAYGIKDYMKFLIGACSKNEKQVKYFTELHKKNIANDNISDMIHLLITIGSLFEDMKGSTEDYMNAIFSYSFAMEKCIFKDYDKIKIELSIKCAQIYVIISKKEKINEEEYNGTNDDVNDDANDDDDYNEDPYNLSTEPENHILYECEYLGNSIIMYNIAVEIFERTKQNQDKLMDVLFEIAKIQKKQRKYKDAIATLNKCLRISITLKTIIHPESLFIISELANIHRLILEFGQSFKYYNMVFKHQNSINIDEPTNYIHTLKLLKTMISLGHVSFFQGNCIEALDYYTTALKKSEKIIKRDDNIVIGHLLTCISTVYIYSNHPEKALLYRQILIERGLNTTIIDETYKKYNIYHKFCACCYQMKEKLFLCSGCHKVHYCNQAHQIKDWSNHKLFCSKETSSKIKLQSLKPKFMALTQTSHHNEIFETLFYIKNQLLYKKAVKGDLYSIAQLARLCHENCYYNESFKWFGKIAVIGQSGAEYYIGLSYLYGKGTHKNITEAIKWLLLASNKYNADAQYELGVLYYNINNTAEAVGWIKLAAAQKHTRSIKMLENLGAVI